MNNAKCAGRVKSAYLVGGGLIIVFSVMAMLSFGMAMTPYVTIAQARDGEYCQVTARVVHSTRYFDSETKMSLFDLESEEGERLKIAYRRPLPANFDSVKQVSVKGRYKGHVFEADEVLTK